MAGRLHIYRIHEIEQKKKRELDAEQVRLEDRERNAAKRGLGELRLDESRATAPFLDADVVLRPGFDRILDLASDDRADLWLGDADDPLRDAVLLLVETVGNDAVFERDDKFVILREIRDKRLVDISRKARIDHGRVKAPLSKLRRHLLRELEKGAEAEERNLLAAVDDLEAAGIGEVGLDRNRRRSIAALTHADYDRALPLRERPLEHGEILRLARGTEEDYVRDVGHHRDVEEADMRDVVHRRESVRTDDDHRRVRVDRQIMRKLIVRALDERRGDEQDRTRPALRQRTREGSRMLLADAGVDELPARAIAAGLNEAAENRHRRVDYAKGPVRLHPLQEILGRPVVDALSQFLKQPAGLVSI